MVSMLLYLFAFLSFAWAQYDANDQSIESKGVVDFLITKNERNTVRKNLGLWIEDQKTSASGFGLSCEAEWDLLCTGETVNDCSCLRYYKSESPVRYSTAELICSSLGGTLPIIHSDLKNKITFVYPDSFREGAWIGLSLKDGNLKWADGSQLTFENWNTVNNTQTGDGECVNYVGDGEPNYNPDIGDFKWELGNCRSERNLICEKRPNTTSATTIGSQSATTIGSESATTIVSQSEITPTEGETTTEEVQPDSCPTDYSEECFGTCYCYKVKKDTPLYWGDAVAACKTEGADLVSIHSIDENQYIRNILLNQTNSWIGSLYGSTNWVDGTILNYKNWRGTQYDDYTAGYMNNAAYNGQWLTVSNFNTKLYFVCKKLKE
ncbi:macrophage mannose receptor 1-like isoform X2 [Artemia franciscana]|uniref:macrophage mannose receptor 1-like isoform X1 n=1 Tax=Artemia franciscana TaxID=6661 RepID=UPI0032DA1AB0